MLARAQVELDSHRTLWEQARSSQYTYEHNVLSECSDNLGQTVEVTVTNGDIESVVYAEFGEYRESCTPPVRWGGGLGYHTIDSLFGVIQDAITDEADQLTVSYNSEFGYPTNVEIDYMSNSIDDEYTLTANAYSPRYQAHRSLATSHHANSATGTFTLRHYRLSRHWRAGCGDSRTSGSEEADGKVLR